MKRLERVITTWIWACVALVIVTNAYALIKHPDIRYYYTPKGLGFSAGIGLIQAPIHLIFWYVAKRAYRLDVADPKN